MAIFLASREGVPVGMAAGMDGDRTGQCRLVAVWVHPTHRVNRVATIMVESVAAWARHDGAVELALWVTRTNDAAVHLYRRMGFESSGKSKPLPSDPTLLEDQWILSLR